MFQCLMANGRFQSLVANGRRKRKKRKSIFSHFPTFPQQILLKPSFFPLILRFYFTMVLGCYLCISFLFLDLYITTTHFNLTSLSHIHYRFDFDWRFFFFSWNYGVTYGHVLWASTCTSEWRTGSGVISRFDIDATSLWWRSQLWKVRAPFEVHPP